MDRIVLCRAPLHLWMFNIDLHKQVSCSIALYEHDRHLKAYTKVEHT